MGQIWIKQGSGTELEKKMPLVKRGWSDKFVVTGGTVSCHHDNGAVPPATTKVVKLTTFCFHSVRTLQQWQMIHRRIKYFTGFCHQNCRLLDVNSAVRSQQVHILMKHNSDVIMSTLASQITSFTIVYSIVYSGVYQSKHQISALLAFVRGIHRWPVNILHKGQVTRKIFPFDDVVMNICDKLSLTRTSGPPSSSGKLWPQLSVRQSTMNWGPHYEHGLNIECRNANLLILHHHGLWREFFLLTKSAGPFRSVNQHYSDVTTWSLNSPAKRLFVQSFFQANNKENKVNITGPFWGKSPVTSGFHHKGPICRFARYDFIMRVDCCSVVPFINHLLPVYWYTIWIFFILFKMIWVSL